MFVLMPFEVGGIAAAVVSAYHAGLLRALAQGEDSCEGFAARLDLHPRGVQSVCDVLVSIGLAEESGGRYRASQSVLDLDATQSGGLEMFAALLDKTPALLRTGLPVLAMDGHAATREFFYQGVVAAWAKSCGDSPARLAESLPPRRAILDIGAGAGVWGLAMAGRSDDGRVTALDFPRVLDVFRLFARRASLAGRVETIAGDYHQTALTPASFDRVILANVLHLEPEAQAAALVRRAATALVPGGDVVVVDVLGGDTADEARWSAIYKLHLSLRTVQGRAHPPEAIAAWMTEAGLDAPRRIALPTPPGMGALVAARGTA